MDLTSSPSEESLKHKQSGLPYVLLCACFVVLSGYRFCDDGRYFFGDSSIHVPLVMLQWDETLFHGDIVHEGKNGFVTYFFPLLGKLSHNIRQLEIAYFVCFIAFNFLSMLSLVKISRLFFKDEPTAFFSAACAYFGLVPMLGGNFPYNEMVHSTAAFPLILYAIVCFFEKRLALCGALLGIAANFHGIYSLMVFLTVGSYFILGLPLTKGKAKTMLLFTASFIALSLPILRMKSGYVGTTVPMREWLSVLTVRAPHHFFPQFWERDVYIRFFLFCGLAGMSLSSPDIRAVVQRWKKELTAFALMTALMIFAATFFVLVMPVRIAVELTGFRATLLLVILFYPLIISYLIQKMRAGNIFSASPALLMLCALMANYYTNLLLLGFVTMLASLLLEKQTPQQKALFLVPLLCAFFLLFLRHTALYVWKGSIGQTLSYAFMIENSETFKIIKCGLFFLCLAPACFFARSKSLVSGFLAVCLPVCLLKVMLLGAPSFYVGASGEYKDVQLFAKQHTAKNALFLVPPYLTSFRTYSERGIYTDFKSGTYSSYNPLYARLWWKRINDLGITTSDSEKMKKTYNNLSTQKINMLSKKYAIMFFVTESRKTYPYPVAYRNKTFVVYTLTNIPL